MKQFTNDTLKLTANLLLTALLNFSTAAEVNLSLIGLPQTTSSASPSLSSPLSLSFPQSPNPLTGFLSNFSQLSPQSTLMVIPSTVTESYPNVYTSNYGATFSSNLEKTFSAKPGGSTFSPKIGQTVSSNGSGGTFSPNPGTTFPPIKIQGVQAIWPNPGSPSASALISSGSSSLHQGVMGGSASALSPNPNSLSPRVSEAAAAASAFSQPFPAVGSLLPGFLSGNDLSTGEPYDSFNFLDATSSLNESTGFGDSVGNDTSWFELQPEDELRVSFALGLFFCLAYGIVFVIGIVGNSFVVAVVMRTPRMRTPTNFFIVNLALADLLVLIFCLPVTLIGNIYSAWILGQWICKIVPYLQGVSVSASIDTLIAIAIERYLAICHPMKCQISSRSCRILIIIIWTFSFTVTLPWAIFFQLTPLNPAQPNSELMVCTEKWPDQTLGNVYFIVAHLVLCYLLPLTLITICYTLILRKVSMRKIPQETKNLSTELLVQRSKMKVIKMLLLVCVLFAMSWLPLYAIFTRVKFGPQPSEWEDQLIRTITPMAQWLGSSNSCINPILYAFFNKKYRSGFKAVLTSRSCCSTLRVDASKSDSSNSRSSNRINLSTQVYSLILNSSRKRVTVTDSNI